MKALITGLLIGGAALLPAPMAVHAQEFPTKPVRIISTGPGGSSDTFARVLAEELSKVWKHPVVVENKSGVGGLLTTMEVARAAPDGHTLLINTNAFIVTPLTSNAANYDPTKTFVSVAMVGKGPLLLVSRPDFPAQSFADIVKTAKEKPDALTFASTGLGGITHLSAEILFRTAGIKLRHIPFTNGAQATTNVSGGHVDLYLGSVSASIGLVKNGAMKAYAVTAAERSPFAENIPTFAEKDLPGFSLDLWWGIFAPAGTPAAAVNEINTQINKILVAPKMKQFLANEGVVPAPMPAAEFSDYLSKDYARWKKVIEDINFQKQ